MLHQISVVSNGGQVMFARKFLPLKGNPINSLIQHLISAQDPSAFITDGYELKWRSANDLDLIFVVAYQALYPVPFAENLLRVLEHHWRNSDKAAAQLEKDYDVLSHKCEQSYLQHIHTNQRKQKAEPSQSAVTSQISSKTGKQSKQRKQDSQTKASTGKQGRVWDQQAANANAKLDYCDTADVTSRNREEIIEDVVDFYDSESDSKMDGGSRSANPLVKFLQSVSGTRVLTADDLVEPLQALTEHLVAKNVASVVADAICSSLAKSLVGQTMETFTVSGAAKNALQGVLTQILTPPRRIDVVSEALTAKQQGRPFSIVFCGVNGVGKSTSLAKVALLLLQANLSVSIAACDTFRAGAVQQLQKHVDKLSNSGTKPISLYQRGYGRDPVDIAADALRSAKAARIDVVLIDTAGRMQGNHHLMRGLARLVEVNSPDLVLFVGEALVGNDAVDQLTEFNRILRQEGSAACRGIDGIILTKCDTIEDKIGAAVSMTYCSGVPIVFRGNGQHYVNLRKFDVGRAVNMLLQ
eukprot:TRINITY_DN6562_c0_g1_i1.p1 TRINITY_DN6562_c0_g1~~TRINITY_DN6562_c0_g1_i1.p1  ORF type:complete len:526 (+),score=95.88 TRINITY_DN6562_c0_g1_i1:16-1593(+)